MNALLERFPQARVCMPVLPEPMPVLRYPLNVDHASIEALPPLRSTIKAQKYFLQVRKTVRRFAESVDNLPEHEAAQGQPREERRKDRADRKDRGPENKREHADPEHLIDQPAEPRHKKEG